MFIIQCLNLNFWQNFYIYNQGRRSFLPGAAKFKKRALFLLKRHCQQKQILVVMLQFEILVDMIEFQFAQDRPVSRKSFILLICILVRSSFRPMPTLFNKLSQTLFGNPKGPVKLGNPNTCAETKLCLNFILFRLKK